MTRGSIDWRRQRFIKGMVNVNNVAQMSALYKSIYPMCKSDETARTSSYKLLQSSTIVKAIEKLRQEKEDLIKRAQLKEIERQAKHRIASEIQIDARLSEIALGVATRKKKIFAFNGNNKTFAVHEYDESTELKTSVSAANLLYKRKGSFAPKAIKHEMGDKFLEVMQIITSRKHAKPVTP